MAPHLMHLTAAGIFSTRQTGQTFMLTGAAVLATAVATAGNDAPHLLHFIAMAGFSALQAGQIFFIVGAVLLMGLMHIPLSLI